MAATPVIIELGGQKFIRTADMKVISLFRYATTTTDKSMETFANSSYQVPALKTFKALEYWTNTLTNGIGTIRVTDETVVNTVDPNHTVIEANPYDNNTLHVNFDHDFDATHFIGCRATTNSCNIIITGIEMDA